MQHFPHPNDASYKISLRLANWPQRYSRFIWIMTERWNDRMMKGQGKSSIAPLFQSGAVTMMGPRPQCYISSQKVIGPLVLEKKISEGFLPYMGVVAILVMWPRPHKQTFIPPSQWGSIWNLALIAPVVWRRRSLKMVDGQRTDHGYTISSPMNLKVKGSSFEQTCKYSSAQRCMPSFNDNGHLIIWPKSEDSGLLNIGHIMALVYPCWSHIDTSSYEISICYH